MTYTFTQKILSAWFSVYAENFFREIILRAREDSNLCRPVRSGALYPLSYGRFWDETLRFLLNDLPYIVSRAIHSRSARARRIYDRIIPSIG